MHPLLLVMAGGAIGSGARHLVGRAAAAIVGPDRPHGTLVVNVAGGLLMGLLAGLAARGVSDGWRAFAGAGVLGGFTTFSAFSLDVVRLAQADPWAGAAYAFASVAGSIAALVAGLRLAAAVA